MLVLCIFRYYTVNIAIHLLHTQVNSAWAFCGQFVGYSQESVYFRDLHQGFPSHPLWAFGWQTCRACLSLPAAGLVTSCLHCADGSVDPV